jgi:hypothetical protein
MLFDTTTSDAATNDISFMDIDQSYTHLWVIAQLRQDGAADAAPFSVTMNGDTSAVYTSQRDELAGGLSAAWSGPENAIVLYEMPGGATIAQGALFLELRVPFYHATTFFKQLSVSGKFDYVSGPGYTIGGSGTYRSTDPVTRLDILAPGGTHFAVGSRAALYGIV